MNVRPGFDFCWIVRVSDRPVVPVSSTVLNALDCVNELVSQQPIAPTSAGRIAARGEPDLGAAGKGLGVQRRRDGMCPPVVVHPHAREIARKNPLESIAGLSVQRLSGGRRTLSFSRV